MNSSNVNSLNMNSSNRNSSKRQSENEQFKSEQYEKKGEQMEDKKMTGPNKSIGFRVRKLNNLLKRNMQLTISNQNFVDEVTASNGYIIGYLYENRGQTIYQKDIEKRFGLGKSAVANLMARMEENDLILREVEKSDTRLKRVSLTPKGEQVHHRIIQSLRWLDQKHMEHITPEEREIFFRILDKIENSAMEVSGLLQGQEKHWIEEVKDIPM